MPDRFKKFIASCQGKQQFASYGAAEKVQRRRLDRKVQGAGRAAIYRCEFCRAWHIGHNHAPRRHP